MVQCRSRKTGLPMMGSGLDTPATTCPHHLLISGPYAVEPELIEEDQIVVKLQ